MLANNVNPEDIVHRLQHTTIGGSSGSRTGTDTRTNDDSHITPYASRYTSQAGIPKYHVPKRGCPSDTAYQMLKDELELDERPSLNLASFVTTWMEPNARALLAENADKNLADCDEYPAMMDVHDRCVSMLAHLWGVHKGDKAIGSATTGSSEAIHLGGLAMKRRWQDRRKKEGKDWSRPNIIMGANAQVALEKFARYFEVESRILPVSAKSKFRLDPDLVKENIDENTIGIYVILGSTMTGHYEPVEEISKILDEYEEKTSINIPIHVDAASGGFIAPFTHAGTGGAKWDFELPRVVSINVSGHKYGLVYPGVGWIVWRDEAYLPESLVFTLDYLGGEEKSFTLNFSRPGAQVIVQYYNLIHLGFAGYREVMENCLRNARLLARSLEATPWFTVVSDTHRHAAEAPSVRQLADESNGDRRQEEEAAPNGTTTSASALTGAASTMLSDLSGKVKAKAIEASNTATTGGDDEDTSAHYAPGLPLVAFRFNDEFRAQFPHIQQSTVVFMLRARHWIIPNYKLPPDEQETEIMRVVIRENMTYDIMERLLSDMHDVMETLMERDDIDLTLLQQKPRNKKGRGGVSGGGDGKDRDAKKQEEQKEQNFSERVQKETQKLIDGNLHKGVC